MKKINIVFLGIGLCAGLVIGSFTTYFLQAKDSQLNPDMYRRFQERDRAGSILLDVVNPFSALVLLRKGKTSEAIEMLEQRMGVALFILADSKVDNKVGYGSLVKKIAEYRKKYPWKSKFPKLNEKVDAFLAEKSK